MDPRSPFRAVVGQLPVLLFVVDRNGVCTLSEGRGLAALGLKPGEAVGRSAYEVYREFPDIQASIRRALSGEEVRSTLALSDRAYEVRYAPLPDGKAGVGAVLGLAVDVTERRRSEEGVREQTQVYESLPGFGSGLGEAMATDLRRGIDADELILHYQPQIHMRTRRLSCVEALVRWRHPQRGLLLPLEFIPLAEETGLIKPLTLWVLKEALRECRRWHAAGLDLPVAVNLSMRNLIDPELPALVERVLAVCAARPDWLWVEVSQSAVMAEPERAQRNMTALRDLGVFIAIDDFGTGYSSLAQLHRLAAHQVKIDRSLIAGIAADKTKATIVRACVDMAHDLGFDVAAEGVEDRASWEVLSSLQCDTAQGHFMSRPMAAGDVDVWLAASRWTVGRSETTATDTE